MANIQSKIRPLTRMLRGRLPGQLVIQITDRCNATCPQCGMRSTNGFPRTRLSTDRIKAIIDAAGEKGIQAISFTGGEPMLLRKELPELVRHAGAVGIPYIRTGTNGFFFSRPERPGFEQRIRKIAEELANTPLRNFWISLDSALPHVHESMRGFEGVVRGMEKALPLFHDMGLFPSVNLGLNRNLTPQTMTQAPPHPRDLEAPEHSKFYQAFTRGFEAFYQMVASLGFTIANACYPMSMEDNKDKEELDAVYAAASPDRVVCFTPVEKALLFKALLDTIPKFRSSIRIFSPLTALHTLHRSYSSQSRQDTGNGEKIPKAFTCRGGIDFFYVNCQDGNTYPCGYRGTENLGPFQSLDMKTLDSSAKCLACDWECFRDPSELAGPFMEGIQRPWQLAARMVRDKEYARIWIRDLQYYKACDFFNGREAPDYMRMEGF